jgi:hypothetical protein
VPCPEERALNEATASTGSPGIGDAPLLELGLFFLLAVVSPVIDRVAARRHDPRGDLV